MRVLIVDDDFMVAKVHSAFVERTPGFAVVGTAQTGAQALEQVARLRPDLVLLDVYLPDMTGLEVLQRLRSTEGALSEVDVLIVSAAKDVDSVKQALRGGVVSYLIKPFHYDDLRLRLEQLAEVRRRLSELTSASDRGAQQADVDRLFGAAAPASAGTAAAPPKGLSPETVALVGKVLRDAGEAGVSATECADRTGLSRVSARRYLEHLAQVGAAEVWSRYGGAGRPERRFRPNA